MKIDTPPFLENKTESEPWTSILGDQVWCLKWKWTPFLPTHWNRVETSFKSVENQWWVQLGSGHPTPSHIIKHHFKRFHPPCGGDGCLPQPFGHYPNHPKKTKKLGLYPNQRLITTKENHRKHKVTLLERKTKFQSDSVGLGPEFSPADPWVAQTTRYPFSRESYYSET